MSLVSESQKHSLELEVPWPLGMVIRGLKKLGIYGSPSHEQYGMYNMTTRYN